MKLFLRTILLPLLLLPVMLNAQITFKSGWNTYQAGMLIHEYTYNFSNKEAIKLNIVDSSETYVTADSLVAMTEQTLFSTHQSNKKTYFINSQKKAIKCEKYRSATLDTILEWKYDDKGRKASQVEDVKSAGSIYKKTYDYATEKNGENVIIETSYLNNKIEYITKSYFDKSAQKVKEVRLNDNNKDIMHVETYTYGANHKLIHRTVNFPQFKVTKEFDEPDGTAPDKCFKSTPCGIPDKVSQATKIDFLKKLLTKNQNYLSDVECEQFEYKFISAPNCEVIVRTTKVNKGKQVILRFKEKV